MFVLDGLNIHWSAGLVKWIANRCEPDRPLEKKSTAGVLQNQATRREFLSDERHRIRFVYLVLPPQRRSLPITKARLARNSLL